MSYLSRGVMVKSQYCKNSFNNMQCRMKSIIEQVVWKSCTKKYRPPYLFHQFRLYNCQGHWTIKSQFRLRTIILILHKHDYIQCMTKGKLWLNQAMKKAMNFNCFAGILCSQWWTLHRAMAVHNVISKRIVFHFKILVCNLCLR